MFEPPFSPTSRSLNDDALLLGELVLVVCWARRAARFAPRASPPRRPMAAMCSRFLLTVTPPLRPAARASLESNSCAVPFWCAARPPLLAISRCFERSIEAKPRLLRRVEPPASELASLRLPPSLPVLRAERPPSLEISRCRSRSAPKLRSSLFGLIAIPAPPESGGPLCPVPHDPDVRVSPLQALRAHLVKSCANCGPKCL